MLAVACKESPNLCTTIGAVRLCALVFLRLGKPCKARYSMLASASSSRPYSERRGAIIVLTAVLMVFLLGIIALAVDIGFVASTRTELQAAADSGAYAGTGALVNGSPAAISEATTFYTLNKAEGGSLSPPTSLTSKRAFGNDMPRTFTAEGAVAVRIDRTRRRRVIAL
jgi:Flp pilus assembly protein TadG